jgi:glycosyltransferase involved in cell wall biosynthesis
MVNAFIMLVSYSQKHMLPAKPQELPIITVGIITLNREWIIRRMLKSVLSQTYPHSRLFVVVVDGKSKDKTAEIAKQVLSESDFNGFEVVVKDSNIPEARNLCIQNMKGDFLLFWDSDVIMEPTAVERMLEIQRKENVDMVSSYVKEVTVNSPEEIDSKWQEWEAKYPRQDTSQILYAVGTGNLLITKKVVTQLKFDPDYTFYEDQDFSARASKLGYKILETRNVIGFDVNAKIAHSDIYAFDMPLNKALRGIRKKAIIQAQNITAGSPSVRKATSKFLLKNKRYLFYIGYIPAIAVTVVGVLLLNLWVALVFPAYLLIYAALQFRKRGVKKGLNATARSILVGIPSTYALLWYCLKLSFKRPTELTSKL